MNFTPQPNAGFVGVDAPASPLVHKLRSFLYVNDLVPRQFGLGARFISELGRRAASDGIRMGILLAGEPIPMVAEAFRGAGIDWWSLPDWKASDDQERRWRFVSGFRRVNALEDWDVVVFNHCNPVSVICACTWSRIRDGRRFARVWHQHQGVPRPRGIKKYVSTLRLLGPFMDAPSPIRARAGAITQSDSVRRRRSG